MSLLCFEECQNRMNRQVLNEYITFFHLTCLGIIMCVCITLLSLTRQEIIILVEEIFFNRNLLRCSFLCLL